jgi:hypothetical protein
MKVLIWASAGLFALCWTLLIAVMASLTNWLAGSADQAAGSLKAISQWPVPSWISLYVDPALVAPMKSLIAESMNVLVAATPWLTPLLAWVAPLLWVVWALVMLLVVTVALGGQFVARRLRGHDGAGR